MLSAQHSALAKVEEAWKFRKEVKYIEERLEVAQVATSKSCIDAKMAERKAFKLEANFVAEV